MPWSHRHLHRLYVDHGADILISFRWTAAPTAIYGMLGAVREVWLAVPEVLH